MKQLILVIVFIFTFVGMASAADIEFAWTANTEADLAGYRIFQRDVNGSYNYVTPVAEILAGTQKCVVVITDQDWKDEKFRWVLRAFDTGDNESGDSNECGDRKPDIPIGVGCRKL